MGNNWRDYGLASFMKNTLDELLCIERDVFLLVNGLGDGFSYDDMDISKMFKIKPVAVRRIYRSAKVKLDRIY